jgi:hypothetical protein
MLAVELNLFFVELEPELSVAKLKVLELEQKLQKRQLVRLFFGFFRNPFSPCGNTTRD